MFVNKTWPDKWLSCEPLWSFWIKMLVGSTVTGVIFWWRVYSGFWLMQLCFRLLMVRLNHHLLFLITVLSIEFIVILFPLGTVKTDFLPDMLRWTGPLTFCWRFWCCCCCSGLDSTFIGLGSPIFPTTSLAVFNTDTSKTIKTFLQIIK